MSIKVVKFGGSSLADADKFRRVAEIIAADPDRRYVVPSAPGKRFSDDIKITDMLYQCYNLARDVSTKEEFETCYSNICARFQGIITDLSLDFDISGELAYIKNAILGRAGRDFAASRGEYLSGLILAKFIGFDFIDAENVIFFKDKPITLDDLEKTLSKMAAEDPDVPVLVRGDERLDYGSVMAVVKVVYNCKVRRMALVTVEK